MGNGERQGVGTAQKRGGLLDPSLGKHPADAGGGNGFIPDAHGRNNHRVKPHFGKAVLQKGRVSRTALSKAEVEAAIDPLGVQGV